MFYVYILYSKRDSKRYIGFTEDLKRRLSEHNAGLVKSTKYRRPLNLIYFEKYELKQDAMNREKFFKSGRGRDFLKKLNK